jgi:hypothetical protein
MTGSEETTYNPDETTATPETTGAGPSRTVLLSIIVEFTGTASHEEGITGQTIDSGFGEWCGRVFTGILTYYLKNCETGVVRAVPCAVKSGGYRVNYSLKGPVGMPSQNQNLNEDFWINKPWLAGSDTSWPPGSYELHTSFHVGELVAAAGYNVKSNGEINTTIDGKSVKRTFMKVHFRARKNGSSGCIVFENQGQWSEFMEEMDSRNKNCPKAGICSRVKGEVAGRNLGCVGVSEVPFFVTYSPGLLPVYKLSSGAILESSNPHIPIAIPAE